MRSRQGFFSATLVIFLAGTAHAELLAPGMHLPEIRLPDQHGVEATIGTEVRAIVFTRDMDGGGIVKEALADKGNELLAAGGAVYVSDISGMPGVIAKLFAVPAMRNRAYRMLLDRDGKTTTDLPFEKGKVTLIRLDAGEVAGVEYLESADQLRAALTPAIEPVR